MSEVAATAPLREVLPICVECRIPMALKRFRAGRRLAYIGKFECAVCHRIVTRPIELQATSSPPLFSTFPPDAET
jgi:hypothetical protein